MKAAKATKPITSAFAQRRSNSMNEKRKNHGWRMLREKRGRKKKEEMGRLSLRHIKALFYDWRRVYLNLKKRKEAKS